MIEDFFIGLPILINIAFIIVAIYILARSSHYLVDGAVYIAHRYRVSPLIIGATVVAMGTTSAENTVNLVVVLTGGETSTVVGNLLGSNLINFGIELGVSALLAGVILVPRITFEKDIPLYFATIGMATALAIDGQISRGDALLAIGIFLIAMILIVQYARAKGERSVLLVEVTEIEAISHPTAVGLTRVQAFLYLVGGLIVLVLTSRFLILNTASLAVKMGVPEFIIGLAIIGPGTSLPEIASSIQAARRGHADLVLGTAFGSCLFNLSLGLGLPAMIRPLEVGQLAIQSFVFINVVNLLLLTFILVDSKWLGRSRTINRVIGAYLITTYIGFISFQVVRAAGGTFGSWLKIIAVLVVVAAFFVAAHRLLVSRRVPHILKAEKESGKGKILCATRGGEASRPTHEKALELAKEQGAEVLFLYVFDQRVLQGVATPIVINVEAQVEQMYSYLRSTAQVQARQAGVSSKVLVRLGGLREQIATVAVEEQVNLIILGNPAEKSSLFKREALRILGENIEGETGVPVMVLIDLNGSERLD
jgi:cation:H+ antiporter